MNTKTLGRLMARVAVVGVAVGGVVVAVAAPSSAALPGLERVTAIGEHNSDDHKNVTATCPSGKQLIGATYVVGGATQSVVVDEIVPSGSATTAPTSVRVEAYEADPLATNWGLRADAYCANPLPGLVRVTAASVDSSADFHSATAQCPTGKVMTGAGYLMDGARGEAVVDDFRPVGGSTTSPPTAVFVGAYEEDAYADSWEVEAYAICANPVSGLMMVTETSASNANDDKNEVASCPVGRVLTSAGFEITGATGEVAVDDFITGVATGTTVIASELDPLATNWSFTAYGICANQ